MKKRKRVTKRAAKRTIKLWAVLALAVSFIIVQTVQIVAEASDGNVDLSNPSVVVNSISELQNAVENAEDGAVIGINSVITVDTNVGQMGSNESDKHLYLVRVNGNACFDIVQGGNLTLCNMTIDGNKSYLAGYQPMFLVTGMLFLNNCTVQNCSSPNQGGAVFIEGNGNLVTEGVVFDGNSAYQGGHIYSGGSANLNNSIFKNGTAASDGGAVKVCSGTFLSLSNCKLYENRASAYGGGISNSGNTTLSGSIIYGNTAPAGADIANDIHASRFVMDSITDVAAVYEEAGVTPVEWVYDCSESTPDIEALFDSTNPDSLLKLIYENHNSDGGDTGNDENGGDNSGDDTGGSGDNTDNAGDVSGNDTGNTGNDENNTGNGDNNAGDNAGNTGDNGNNAGNDNTGNSVSTSTNSGTIPQTAGTADSHDNKSTTSTTTNNYYTYNTPANNTTASEKKSSNNQTETKEDVNAVKDTEKAGNTDVQETKDISGISADSANVQIPDNIKLNLNNVDIVYEMTDGVSNIEISNERKESGQADNASVVPATSVAAGEVPAVESSEKESALNWYEIIKMILLAAILLVVIPKPTVRRTANSTD